MATRYQYLQAKLAALSINTPRLIAAGCVMGGDVATVSDLCEQLMGEVIEASRAADNERAARYQALYDAAVHVYEDLRNAIVNGPPGRCGAQGSIAGLLTTDAGSASYCTKAILLIGRNMLLSMVWVPSATVDPATMVT